MRKTCCGTVLAGLLLLAAVEAEGADFFVAPDPVPGGNGSVDHPWSLTVALSHPPDMKPGDTIWLRGGTYVGIFTSSLTGTLTSPIQVRQYPGERATLDGGTSPPSYGEAVLTINGAYTWYMGFEVTNSDTIRTNSNTGSNPPNERAVGLNVYAPGTRLINMVIHDTGQGVGLWSPATDSEVNGCLIYYNGWDAPDRGHGHGIYTQNQAPSVHRITDNILFDGFALGVQAYTEGGHIDNIDLAGNTAFGNGVLSLVSGGTYNLLIGGLRLAANPSMISNFTYSPPGTGGKNGLGYSAGCTNGTVTGNYFGGNPVLTLVNCSTGLSMTGNTFYGALDGFASSQYPSNTYYSSRPTGTQVFVRPNRYEAGRANITVYNWDLSASVPVDLSSVLSIGAQYEIRNAQNFYGPPVVSGTYAGGFIALPQTGLTPVTPVGRAAPPATGPEFNTFVVLTPGGTFVATRVLPVIVDAVGQKGAHFSTRITLANRGVTPASVSLTYTAPPRFGGPSATVTDSLLPGRQLVIPDGISYLRSRGLSLGSGNEAGSLTVTFKGLSSPEASHAGARITTPSGSGRAGTALASVRPEDGFESRATVFGLRESQAERSNLALVNLDSSGSITLALTAFSGRADGRSATLTPVTLGPGEWIQVGSPLGVAGFDSGFITVERKAGTGRYFTYGVVNDNITNDASLISPVPDGVPPEDQCVPVVVETAAFESDLVLANPETQPVTATLSYVESLASAAGTAPFSTDIQLGALEQRLISSAIDFLRQRGLNIGPRNEAGHAGAVGVRFSREGATASGYVGALTATAAPRGGRYGVFYNGVPISLAAAGGAWLFDLQQDDTSRSNVAVASTGSAGEAVTFHLEVYDGDTGGLKGRLGPFILTSRGWIQFSGVLAEFGVSNGYVRVVGTAGGDRLVVYGVVNDGETSTSGRTNDGSIISSPNN